MQNIVGNCRAPKKRSKETDESNYRRLFPFRPEDLGIEFGPGQKRENDGAGTGEKTNPACLPAKFSVHEECANHQLSHSADDNLAERRGHLEPNGNQRRDQGQTDPHSGQYPHIFHGRNLDHFCGSLPEL